MRTILFAVLITLSLATTAQKLLLLADEIPASSLSFEQRERLDAVESDELASEIRIGRFSLDTLRAMQHQMQPSARANRVGKADYSIYSHDEETGDEISLVIMGQDVLGRIREDGQVYRVKPLGDGATAIYRYDMSRLQQHPEGYEDFIKEEQQDEIQPDQGSQIPILEGENDGSVIDLMVLYTSRGASGGGKHRCVDRAQCKRDQSNLCEQRDQHEHTTGPQPPHRLRGNKLHVYLTPGPEGR